MKTPNIFREITHLSSEDCFIIQSRIKSDFTWPIHVHPEFELNFIEGAKGARRIIGDSMEEIDDLELCLVGNENLEHGWMNYQCKSTNIYEITIQFHENLFLDSLLNKTQFRSIYTMFENAQKGIVFSRTAIEKVKDRLIALTKNYNGFYSVVELLSILHELSNDENIRVLSSTTFGEMEGSADNSRVQKLNCYFYENYQNEIYLADVANYLNMSEVSLSRFIKKHTGKNYIEYLNDLRLGVAARLLVSTDKTISEISFECGFNNLSNFNRIFKKRKGITPKEFRESYSMMRRLI